MNHIIIGVAIPYVLAVIVYLARKCRASFNLLIVAPVFMTIGAVWACIPDIPRLFRNRELYNQLHRDPRSDIFFWHYSIDIVEQPTPLWFILLLIVLLSLLAAAWRELWIRERTTDVASGG